MVQFHSPHPKSEVLSIMSYKGSEIARQIIDDRKREARIKARALKLKKLQESYEKRKVKSNGNATNNINDN